MRLTRLRAESGGALVEIALVVSLVGVPMLFGTVDLAIFIYSGIEVSNAAHAGAVYGMTSATAASDTSGIQTAAQADSSDYGTNLAVTPTTFYACSSALSGTQYSTQSAATTACTGSGNHPLEFVQVVATVTLGVPIHFPGLPTSFVQSNTSIMEVEE
jgi:Flp pilus assembly protein TadG